MDVIKFAGINKKASLKKAIGFFHDNFDDEVTVESLLAKCRLQKDGKTIYFYPYIEVDLDKYRKLKQERKSKK